MALIRSVFQDELDGVSQSLVDLTDMAVSGTFRPLIDSVLPFARMPEAHARADTGRKRGSVVVRLDHIQGQ